MARRRGTATPAGRPELVATRYELLEKVGAGGVANVYKARDTRLNRIVALKILRDEYASDAEFVERFQREAHIAAGLSHPNVVSVDDYGRHGNTAFLAMDFVDGETLKARLRRVGRMQPDEAVGIAQHVLAGLGAAHAQGLVHRDVKPHNVLLGWDGAAKLTDFGIALAAAAVGLTQTGTTVGTAAYAAPEQVTGKTVGPPADVYGVGLLLYEMLTGRPPFGGGSVMELAWAHVNEEPRRPSELVEGVPPELDEMVVRALAKDPAARYADAATMLAALGGAELLTPPLAAHPNGRTAAGAVSDPDATMRLSGAAGIAAAASSAGAAAASAPGGGTVRPNGGARRPLVPASLIATAAGTTARLRQWLGARPSRAIAVPALLGALALGGLVGAPRVIGGMPTPAPLTTPAPTAAVLAEQATRAPEATPTPPAPTPAIGELSGSLGLGLDGVPSTPPVGEPTAAPASQADAPAAVAPAPVEPAPAPAAPAPAEAPGPATDGAAIADPPPTATPAPSATSTPVPLQPSAPAPQQPQPASQPAQPAPSAPQPSAPPLPTATPHPAATAPPKSGSTPAATPGTPGPAPSPATSPAPTSPPASTPVATAAPPAPTAAPTKPGRPPADASPAPTSAAQPTAAPPTPAAGG